MADEYAKAGFYCYVPDFHQGDSLPEEFLQDAEPPLKVREQLSVVDKGLKTANVGATLGPWLIKHREGVSKPLIEGVINIVKSTPGTNKVGAIGECKILPVSSADECADAINRLLLGRPILHPHGARSG